MGVQESALANGWQLTVVKPFALARSLHNYEKGFLELAKACSFP
jgi:hypothetical protein